MSDAYEDLWAAARWERKCVVPSEQIDSLRVWVDEQPLAFRTAYPSRTVRSLYFDSALLDDFQLNVSGVSDRKKLRLRWYGDSSDVQRATLEVKAKRNQLGIKHAWPVEFDRPLSRIPLMELGDQMAPQIPVEARLLLERGGIPSALIVYDRDYFVSADGRVRITLDHDIDVYEQIGAPELNHSRADVFPEVMVLELKYPGDMDTEVRALLGYLPGRLSRFSKYAIGIQTLMDV